MLQVGELLWAERESCPSSCSLCLQEKRYLAAFWSRVPAFWFHALICGFLRKSCRRPGSCVPAGAAEGEWGTVLRALLCPSRWASHKARLWSRENTPCFVNVCWGQAKGWYSHQLSARAGHAVKCLEAAAWWDHAQVTEEHAQHLCGIAGHLGWHSSPRGRCSRRMEGLEDRQGRAKANGTPWHGQVGGWPQGPVSGPDTQGVRPKR